MHTPNLYLVLLARDAQAKLALIVAQYLSIHLCVCPRQLESRVCTQYCASRATSTTGLYVHTVPCENQRHIKTHSATAASSFRLVLNRNVATSLKAYLNL